MSITITNVKDSKKDFVIYDEMNNFVEQCKQKVKNFDKLKFSVGHIEKDSSKKSEIKDKEDEIKIEISWEDVSKALTLLNKKISLQYEEDEIIPFYRIDKTHWNNSIILLSKCDYSKYKPKCIMCDKIHEHEKPFITINNDSRKSVWFGCRRSKNHSEKLGELFEKKKYSKQKETLEINFTTDSSWGATNLTKINKFIMSLENPKQNHQIYRTKTNINQVKYGVYKLPPFNDVYVAMLKYFPNIIKVNFLNFLANGNDDFHNEYNQQFVEHRVYTNDVDCVNTYYKYVTSEEDKVMIHNTLSIIVSDLEKNADLLIEILSSI